MNYSTFNLKKITVYWIGKTGKSFIEEGLALYKKRISHYCKMDIQELKDVKNKARLDPVTLKKSEAALVIQKISAKSFLILLDEKGRTMNSRSFSQKIEEWQQQSLPEICFLIGGAFGVDESIRNRANMIISLSEMTFSHQFIRLILFEQLYRAFSIIRGEKYHND